VVTVSSANSRNSRQAGTSPRLERLFRAIHQVIRAVPRGRVATYGQVAELAGLPGGARVSAAALRTAGRSLPWHRIVGKSGANAARIAILDPVGAALQRQLLEQERVVVSEAGRIDLRRYGWLPTAARARGGRPRRPPRSGS
jgi:methylated-DNA-protein-cysteine methyltransferase-like protein